MRAHDPITLTAGITAAYAAGNHIPAHALPDLIATVHGALCGLAGASAALGSSSKLTPAQIRASILPDAIVSFEDGRPYKMLRRHLTHLGMTPEAYRAKWGLPADYPLVPAAYSARRTEISRVIAQQVGLGTRVRGRGSALQAAE